jgi:hypothetical protein
MRTSDQLFGLAWTGAFTEERLLALLPALPPGISEIYAHPATEGGWPGAVPSYRYRDELAAFASTSARARVAELGIRLTAFGDLAEGSGR